MLRATGLLLLASIVATPAAAEHLHVRPIQPLTQGVAFTGDDELALLVELRWLDTFGEAVTGIVLRSPEGGPERWIRLPQRVTQLEATEGGGPLLAVTDCGSLLFVDPVEARVARAIEIDPGGFSLLDSRGAGDALRLLTNTGPEAQLRDASGAVLERFEITGTTPTIIRVYHGGDTMHDNILEDSPSWIVSGALSADGRHVALGGSDSRVRLFDREAGDIRELSFDWPYEERRFLGGNPDLNAPLDLRFVDGTLVGLFVHGDILRWDLSAPGEPVRLDGACSDEEIHASRARFGEPTPWEEASNFARKQARKECAYAHRHGRLSADGARAVTLVNTGVRVRDARTGETLAQLIDSDLDRPIPDWGMAIHPGGRVALVGLYGGISTWTEREGLAFHVVRAYDWRGVEHLSADGRWLTMDGGNADVVWDLHTGDHKTATRDLFPGSRDDTTGSPLHGRFPEDVRGEHRASSADGSAVAWLEQPERRRTKVTWLSRDDGDGAGLATVQLVGFPDSVGISSDGREVLYTIEDGTATRWRPQEQAQDVIKRSGLMMANDIVYLPGDEVIALPGYQALDLVRNDDALTELATLYALTDAEWVLIAADGRAAVSSERALADLLTVVVDDAGGVTLYDGRHGWDQVSSPDLWIQLVTGGELPTSL